MTIVHLLRAGRSVYYRHVVVRGPLRLPPTMDGALVLRDSTIQGDLIVGAEELRNLVDLSGTRITGSIEASAARLDGPLLLLGTRTGQAVDFTFAVFGGAAVFAGADFGGRASFTGAQFHGESRFERVHFAKTTSFAFAGFDHSADFDLANFDGAASFARAEFRGPAGFAYAGFSGAVAFDNARFFAPADFLAAQFTPTTRGARPASFRTAHFDGGAVFSQASFFSGIDFSFADASGDLDFEAATITGDAKFVGGRFQAPVDFDEVTFRGWVDFDEAQLAELDLDGADLVGSTLTLPAARGGIGYVDKLRMDPSDVVYVGVAQSTRTRSDREHALALIAAASRAGGDLSAAAEADFRKLSLHRHEESPPVRTLDWLFYAQAAGYLVHPWNPVIVLVFVFAIAALLRARAPRPVVSSPPQPAPRESFARRLTAFARPQGGQSVPLRISVWLERLLIAAILVGIANRWPPLADILKGVLP